MWYKAVCMVSACFLFITAYATDYTWLGGDGLFSDSAKWSPSTGYPSEGDRAKFSTSEDGIVIWTGDVSNHEMQAVQTAGNTLTLNLGGFSYTMTNRFYFDGSKDSTYIVISNGVFNAPTNTSEMKIYSGVAPARLSLEDQLDATINHFTFYRSVLNIQTGAVVTFNGECKVNDGVSGAYTEMNVSGGDVVCNSHFKCPSNGQPGSTSVLNIASGTLVAKQYCSIGDKNGPESVGIVNLSGGTFETWGTVWLGNSGGACGIANISGGLWNSKGNFEVSHREYTTAFVNMSGGTIEVAPSKYFGVAYAGGTPACDTGTVSMVGGAIIVTNSGSTFYVGAGSNCFGRCEVGGTGSILARDFYVASSAFSEGECVVTGGFVQVNNTLSIGGSNPSEGRMRIDGGVVTNRSSCYVGNSTGSRGTLTMDSGALSISSTLNVGQNTGAQGGVALSGGEVNANYLVVGNNGDGAWVQSNGTVSVGVDVTVGVNGTGSLEMAGGVLTNGSVLYVGKNANSSGQVTVGGGVITSAKGIRVGDWGGLGMLHVSNGTLIGGDGGSSAIGNGNGSTGTVVMTGGLLDIRNSFYVGNNSTGSRGDLNVAGGAVAVSNQLVAGNNRFTYGEIAVSGGSVYVGDDIRLGVQSNTFGRLVVSGGVVTNKDYVDVGHWGTGIVQVTGGELVTRVLRTTPYSYTNDAPEASIIVSGGLLHVTNVFYCSDALFSTTRVALAGGTLKLPQLWNNRGTTIVLCDGGELEATRNEANFINTNVQVLELTANGLYVDSSGYSIGTGRDLPDSFGEHGLLGKRGQGTFELRADTTFTGPVVVEEGELALSSSGLISLAGGFGIDGGALLNLSARDLDFSLPSGTVSRVDGELRLASGKTLTISTGATLSGTGTVGRVVLESGATLASRADESGALLYADELVIPAGAVINLVGYSAEELRQGVRVVTAGTIAVAQSGSVIVTLDGASVSLPVALRVSGGVLTALSYNPGTLISVL